MNDLTQGSPLKKILLFMLPILVGNLFQNLYNVVDIIIVGQFLGVDALAAVGMTGSIIFLVIGWVVGLTNGFGVLISQAYGAKDDRRLRHYVAISTYICIGFVIVMTAGLLLANDTILQLMNTPEEIYYDTKSYITVIYAGLIASFLYNMLASIARAMGDSKTPLYFLAFSSVINIGLDILFVAVLPFGVAGAGYATVLSQVISGVLCLIYVLRKYPEIRFSKEEGQFRAATMIQLLGIGIPMALQFSITAIGTMIVQGSLNLLGSLHIAAFSGSMKIQGILIQFPIAVGAALASFVGQNFGAMKFERVKQGVSAALKIVTGYCVIAMAVAYFICPHLIVLFAEDTNGQLVEISRQLFHICLWFYIPLGLIFVYRNALQGLGNGLVPLLGGIAELIARGLTIVFLFESLQFIAISLTDPIAWLSALIPLVPYYYWYINKMTKRMIAV